MLDLFYLDGVLALSKGVPQLDGLVAGPWHNLTIIGRESDAHDVLGVVLETAGGLAGAEIPQTESLVPWAGQSEVTVRGKHDVGDEMAVTLKTLLGYAVLLKER